MWTLVIFMFSTYNASIAVGSSSIPGFTSKESCNSAGYEIVTTQDDYYYHHESRTVFDGESGLYKVKNNSIKRAYKCIEVK